ncbi:GNAT family N-acetyltransferase [Chitinophaga barathri]|uniref:GNAT family N-acetyltransferase n=1 Tax=Chitinophaga barathri TaxID=1647451 RepID=UPI0013C400AA|nr:GNAT family N-acetyltransferase [Chitinophaga barathri]
MNALNEPRVLSWHPAYRKDFGQLNKTWIEKYFVLEPVDIDVLEHPEEHIIAPGGDIIFVALGSRVAGTVAYRPLDADTVEMTKMGVDEEFQGRKLGWLLGKTIIERAAAAGYKKMVLYSSRKLTPAITMYHKLGFEEAELEAGGYKRCDIKMTIDLKEPPLAGLSRQLVQTVLATEEKLLRYTDEEAGIRPAADKWSRKEVLGHLVDSAMNNYPRFIRGQQAEYLETPGYNQDFWVDTRRYQEEDWQELVQIWKALNLHIVRVLPLISEDALHHILAVGPNAPVTLRYIAEDYLRHVEHHLTQIFPVHANY